MSLDLKIRPAKLADCKACQRLGRVPEIVIAPGWYLPLEYYRKVVKGKHIFLVAEQGGHLVGFVIAEKIEAGFLAQYVVVSKKFRRFGIGERLLMAIEATAKKRGAYFLLGYAVVKSTGIQKILKKLDYRRGQLTYEWSKGLTRNSRAGRLGAPTKIVKK